MSNRIVYCKENGQVCVITPADSSLDIKQVAFKDVPEGLKFWIVDVSSVPSDRTMRDAWEIVVASMGNPDGIGGGV